MTLLIDTITMQIKVIRLDRLGTIPGVLYLESVGLLNRLGRAQEILNAEC
jgi:hypothetical protein